MTESRVGISSLLYFFAALLLLWPHWLRDIGGAGNENVILLRKHWELESRLCPVLNMAASMRTYSQPR